MHKLTVFTPSIDIFNAYYYGYGKVVEQTLIQDRWKTVIDYGEDSYRCEYQAGRFASGLYFAKVEKT